ncbi:alpha/beta hydrolase [Paraburkholderia sp. BL21I4N1]|uniref:alpha/beta hydrolase n=1 Tax=Paraburkholderia sp. BL21I4N1 TaxID=1938801 RepID=UPI0035BE1470
MPFVPRDIDAPGPHGPLRGTLLSAAAQPASMPVVLIVPGSGPTDRNGDGPLVRTSAYRLLAEGLASRAIASVRIDKRGMFGSASAIANADDVSVDDYARDLHTWVTSIRQRTGASCVWVLGHSEGGLVALAAARDTADMCGLILVATAGRPLAQVLREQLKANPANAPVLDNAMSVLASLEAGSTVPATRIDPALLPLFRPQVQRFLMSELSLDPAALLTGYAKPVLIVQGLRDIQVTRDDAERLKRADPRAELALVANANHVLKTVHTDDLSENLATYTNPDLPLADSIVDVISAFVRR